MVSSSASAAGLALHTPVSGRWSSDPVGGFLVAGQRGGDGPDRRPDQHPVADRLAYPSDARILHQPGYSFWA